MEKTSLDQLGQAEGDTVKGEMQAPERKKLATG